MDRLRAAILIAHARVQRERLLVRLERKRMARDMQSLGNAVGLFRLESDQAAGRLFDRMDVLRERRDVALGRTHRHFDAEEKAVEDVERFVADLERANGGPPLDDSQGDSAKHPPPVPPADSAEKKS